MDSQLLGNVATRNDEWSIRNLESLTEQCVNGFATVGQGVQLDTMNGQSATGPAERAMSKHIRTYGATCATRNAKWSI